MSLLLAAMLLTMPLTFTDTVPESLSTAVTVGSIPAGSTGATISLTCFDCDHPDWGTLSVNGHTPVALFPGSSAANTNALGTILVQVPVSDFVVGANTVSITHSQYSGGRIDAVSVDFTITIQGTLTWNANTEDDLASYTVYRALLACGSNPTLTKLLNVGNVTQFIDSTIPAGTRAVCYGVTATDTADNESGLSATAGKSIFDFAPEALKSFTIE